MTAPLSVEFVHAAAEALLPKLRDCVLVLDSAMAATLRWSLKGGFAAIFAGGAVTVKIIDSLEPANDLMLPEPPTIVFLLSTHLARYSTQIRSSLIGRSYRDCQVVSALTEVLHVAELDMEPDLLSSFDAYLGFEQGYFSRIESKLREWMMESMTLHSNDIDEDDIETSVEYMPLSFGVVTNELFTIPLVETVFPPLIPDNREISSGRLKTDSKYPFNMSHAADPESLDLFRVLLMLSQKDALVAARKRLVDLIAKIHPEKKPRVLGKLTLDQMDKLLEIFKDDESSFANYGPLLSTIALTVESAKVNQANNENSMAAIEKLVCVSMSESFLDPACAILPIVDLLKKLESGQNISPLTSDPPTSPMASPTKKIDLSMTDIMKLAVFSFSLMGPGGLPADLKTSLKSAFLRCLCSKRHGEPNELEEIWVNEVLERLEMIANARRGLKEKSLIDLDSPIPYQSLVRRVFSSSLDQEPTTGGLKAVTEIGDLQHIPHGGTLGNVLNKFSRLLGGAQPRVKDFDAVLVFVVGGITGAEVRDIREVARLHGGVNVLVGSTGLCDAQMMLSVIFPRVPSQSDV
ncbi:Sec1 domain-containing protein 2 [Entophlyctis luteolus]|nr:Sec1 domain-containing protein 2 [Entophlyctis luteolus]